MGHGWFKKGVRTPVKIKLGFQSFYLYSAINPKTGKDFTLLLPHVNTEFMNVFLEQMSKSLGRKQAFLIMDCAPWHTAKKLVIPRNIRVFHLPAYSPELNPVERLWQDLKANLIKNKIYKTIKDLENAVCNAILKFNPAQIKSICSFDY